MTKILGTGAIISEADMLQAAKDKVVEVASGGDVPDIKPKPTPPPPEPVAALSITAEQLQGAIAAAVQQTTQSLQAEFDAKAAELETQRLAAVAEANAQRDQTNALTQVFKTLGHPNPVGQSSVNFNTHLASDRDREQGLAKDWVDVCSASPSRTYTDQRTGKRYVQRDHTEAQSFFLQNRDRLRSDMQSLAKKHGFLQGIVETSSATVKSDIAPALLDYLSMNMRVTHSAMFVFWQFATNKLELGKGPGDTIQVPRLRWLTEPTAVADRTLVAGTALSTSRQNITIAAVSLVLAERGLGKSGVTGAEPVAIPEFVTAYSMINLENAVQRVLGHDYEAYVDLSIRSLFDATTRVVYNDAGAVTTTVGNVGSGDDGTLTEAFLNALYAYMTGTLKIPTDGMGCLMLVCPSQPIAQLKNSLSGNNRYMTQANMSDLTNIFQLFTNMEMPMISGYVGDFCNFHIFQSTAFGVGAAGTEGVQNETLGVGSTLTRTSYAFGIAAVARAIGMDAEVRMSDDTDFGRLDSFVWLSHEVSGYLDVDSAINSEQQLRVVDVRTVDVPV